MLSPSERLRKSITKDNLWIYILTLLKKEELYPYQIQDKIKKEFGFYPGNVTPYIVLKMLEKGDYVAVVRSEKLHGPERKYYKITEKGRNEIKKGAAIYKETADFMMK